MTNRSRAKSNNFQDSQFLVYGFLNMIKKLIFVSAMLVPGLAYGANPSADLAVQITPASDPPNSIGCDLGPNYTGSIPAAAAQAGFTHCAANYDFTQTQSFTDNAGTHQWCAGSLPCSIANMASWFTCGGVNSAGAPYLFVVGQNGPSCDANHYTITTNGGVQALALTYYLTDSPAYAAAVYSSGVNGDKLDIFPDQFYSEYVMQPTTIHSCNDSGGWCGEWFDAGWTTHVQGNPCYVGSDQEFDSANPGNTLTGSGMAIWFNTTACGSSESGGYGPPSGNSPNVMRVSTNVGTFGRLFTMDGTEYAAICAYYAPGSVSGLTASATWGCSPEAQLIPPANNSNCCGISGSFMNTPMFMNLTVGPQGGAWTATSLTVYIYRYTVWTCAGYQSGACFTVPVITTAPRSASAGDDRAGRASPTR